MNDSFHKGRKAIFFFEIGQHLFDQLNIQFGCHDQSRTGTRSIFGMVRVNAGADLPRGQAIGKIACGERLGGLPRYDDRDAAQLSDESERGFLSRSPDTRQRGRPRQ